MLAEFTRVTRALDAHIVEAATIRWDGPHRPSMSWQEVERLPLTASDPEIDAARRRLLSDRRYFRICSRCGERQPLGWMGTRRSCHACMERLDGVVF